MLKQQILLKQNENENYEKLQVSLTAKVAELEESYKNLKQVNEAKINELMTELQASSANVANL